MSNDKNELSVESSNRALEGTGYEEYRIVEVSNEGGLSIRAPSGRVYHTETLPSGVLEEPQNREVNDVIEIFSLIFYGGKN